MFWLSTQPHLHHVSVSNWVLKYLHNQFHEEAKILCRSPRGSPCSRRKKKAPKTYNLDGNHCWFHQCHWTSTPRWKLQNCPSFFVVFRFQNLSNSPQNPQFGSQKTQLFCIVISNGCTSPSLSIFHHWCFTLRPTFYFLHFSLKFAPFLELDRFEFDFFFGWIGRLRCTKWKIEGLLFRFGWRGLVDYWARSSWSLSGSEMAGGTCLLNPN